jgi:hypothetical protein
VRRYALSGCCPHPFPFFAGGQGAELGSDQRSSKFEVLFRFYGPEKPLFDKTWALPAIERITAQ